MSENGWIKLHRKILTSDMYRSLNSKQRDILIALLLMANHKEKKWEYKKEIYTAEPGQMVTSLDSIKQNCAKDVSIKNIRTALEKLETWGFLANKSTKTGRLITIVNWGLYQSDDEEPAKTTAEDRQRDGREPAANKNVKNDKNDKEEKKKDTSAKPPSSSLSDSVNEIWNHYVKTFDGFFNRISLTQKRKTALTARLKDGLTADDIKLAITNIRNSPFHCGQNENGKFYADITFICRSLDKVEEWINYTKKVTQFPRKQEGQGYAKNRGSYNYGGNQEKSGSNQDSITGGQIGRIKPPNYARRRSQL